MKKYKDQCAAEKGLTDYVQMKYVRLISFVSFFGLGLWMLLDPAKPEHRSVEKVTVALFKNLWGIPFGIICISIGTVGLIYFIRLIVKFRKGYTWIRLVNGYYFFEDRVRLSGLPSIYDKEDLLVFHPQGNKVFEFKNYAKAELNKYQKAKLSTAYNNDETYWSADESGYTLIYKGESLANTTSEYRGDDLIVKSKDQHLSFLLKNYRNLKDGKIRTASRV